MADTAPGTSAAPEGTDTLSEAQSAVHWCEDEYYPRHVGSRLRQT